MTGRTDGRTDERNDTPTNRDASHLKRPHFSDIALFQNSLYISILSPSFSTQLGSKMDNCSKTVVFVENFARAHLKFRYFSSKSPKFSHLSFTPTEQALRTCSAADFYLRHTSKLAVSKLLGSC